MKKQLTLLIVGGAIALCTQSIAAGIRFGVADAVRAAVKDLDQKVAAGKFRFVNGATNITAGESSLSQKGVRASGGGPPSDGTWALSPNKVRVTINSIYFQIAGGAIEHAVLDHACTVTYDRLLPSRTTLLDCPFRIKAGTYSGLGLISDTRYDVLFDDTDNNIYSDPSSSTGLTSTRPTGGGQFISVTAQDNNSLQNFEQPLTIGEGHPDPVIRLVMDGTHSMRMNVSGGQMTLSGETPVSVVPFVTGSPRMAIYASSTTVALNFPTTASNNVFQGFSIYYESDGQPVYLVFTDGPWLMPCGRVAGLGRLGSSFRNPSILTNPTIHFGKYLGRDNTGTIGGIGSGDAASSGAEQNIFSFTELTAVGTSTTLKYKCESNPPAPSSGNDYSSGVPSFTPDNQVDLQLFSN